MRINDNGYYRDMTVEEIAEMKKEFANLPEPQPTVEEKLQVQIDDINLALADIYGGGL